MTSLKDAPVFPTTKNHISPGGMPFAVTESGMTFRQYAAVHALQGLLSNPNLTKDHTYDLYAKDAFKSADALIKQLEVE